MPKGHFVGDKDCDTGVSGDGDDFGAFRDARPKGNNGDIGHGRLDKVSA